MRDGCFSMRGFVPPDIETEVSNLRYAVVYVPKRNRKRYSAGCVEITDSKSAALQLAKPEQNFFAARILGPSKSSEGQTVFYLVEWL